MRVLNFPRSRFGILGLVAGIACALPATGCTDADLEPMPAGRPFLDNKLSIIGDM